MRIHFISIGGSVMHQLALALHTKGDIVTGSDDEIFEPSRSNLAAAGLLPASLGWDAARITPDLDAILLGMHARADNPELLKAQQLGLPVYSFPEYMYEASRHKTRVVVGGSHGKTTTTSMIMHAMAVAQMPFDYLVGARLPGFAQSVAITEAPVVVCEGDEYPASTLEKRPKFHFLYPHVAILTGIAWDHINVFPTFENYLDQFRIFLDKIMPGGLLIYNSTDPELCKLVAQCHRTDIVMQPYTVPEHRQQGHTTFLLLEGNTVPLKVFGHHNLLNMQAAWLACRHLGMQAATFAAAMQTFTGAARRLEVIAESADRVVYRDFAHAPSKVKATMEAVKTQYPDRKVATALELHTYSSLNEAFMPHYAGALEGADAACVFYSPHAMEIKRMPTLPPQRIVEGFAKPGLQVLTNRQELEQWIANQQQNCQNLLLMSSGNYEGMDVQQVAKNWLPEN